MFDEELYQVYNCFTDTINDKNKIQNSLCNDIKCPPTVALNQAFFLLFPCLIVYWFVILLTGISSDKTKMNNKLKLDISGWTETGPLAWASQDNV